MPFCKACGSFYTKSLGVCPKCNAEERLLEYNAAQAEHPAPSETPKERKRRWITLVIGIPGLIVFLYLMALITKLLS